MRYIFDTHPDVYSPPEVSLGDAAAQLAQLEAGLIGFKLDPARLDQLPAESVAAKQVPRDSTRRLKRELNTSARSRAFSAAHGQRSAG